MKKGLFIAIEGGDSTGKTTICKQLKKRFEADGIDVVITREPGGVNSAELIRKMIFELDLDAKTELFLYLAARREHLLHKIIPALDQGKLVISDRFYLSTLAYQGYASRLNPMIVRQLNSFVCDDIFPDLNFFINLAPEFKYNKKKAELNRIDLLDLEYHQQVYECYKKLCSSSIDKVFSVNGHEGLLANEKTIYHTIKSII